jgi:hypothetical protein
MLTTHLQSSAAARPEVLGEPATSAGDLELLSSVLAPSMDAMRTADEAIRDLVPALREERPYLVTHAPNRREVERRFAELLAAFGRAER